MIIGKIVKSSSHIHYICQIYGPLEIAVPPDISDYTFGHFVRVALPLKRLERLQNGQKMYQNSDELSIYYIVGVIYDTQLLNPSFGSLGPRLSTETQVELFSPDYLLEQAVLVHLVMLGLMEQHRSTSGPLKFHIVHGVPSFPIELNSSVETMTDEDVHRFHLFHDQGDAPHQHDYIHMGYLPHLLVQQNFLISQVILRIIDQLEQLFPQHLSLLSILKRNFTWRLKVESTG